MYFLLLATIPLLPLAGPFPQEGSHPGSGPQGEITVTILFDNYGTDDRLNTGWGFAALLETPGHTILFDTGLDGEALLENFRLMGKDPMAVETIVISHAHGDHTGGIQALLDLGLRPTFYLLPGFPAEMREGGPESVEIVLASPGQEILPGIRTTGQVGEDIPEQALALETRDGTVVITGCAHPGVVQMAERAMEFSPQPLHLVMGGFHLMESSSQEIQGILADFQRLGVQRAGPTHCSGEEAMTAFQNAYGENYQRLGVGQILTFPMASVP
ncbi:MAG: MBL fold metallo-hydrolase [Gemmatimonadota bacterium]|jgi:7,8-dihydropterin-6-yl-methyl-4-(beta-D-ribofuranosyl)aminobenzene 5'-phosphate synthase